jgi:hypothetical protein
LMEVSKYASLGQITSSLFEVGGQYRRNMWLMCWLVNVLMCWWFWSDSYRIEDVRIWRCGNVLMSPDSDREDVLMKDDPIAIGLKIRECAYFW